MTGVDLDEAGNRITVMVADLDEDEGTVEEHVGGVGRAGGSGTVQGVSTPAARSRAGSSVQRRFCRGRPEFDREIGSPGGWRGD